MCDHKWKTYVITYKSRLFKLFPVTKEQDVAICRVCDKLLLERGLKPEDRKAVLDKAWALVESLREA